METNSLTPAPDNSIKEVDFPTAIAAVALGKTISRTSWNDVNEYGLIINDFLTIHHEGKFSTWKVSQGDLEGKDWIIIGE